MKGNRKLITVLVKRLVFVFNSRNPLIPSTFIIKRTMFYPHFNMWLPHLLAQTFLAVFLDMIHYLDFKKKKHFLYFEEILTGNKK